MPASLDGKVLAATGAGSRLFAAVDAALADAGLPPLVPIADAGRADVLLHLAGSSIAWPRIDRALDDDVFSTRVVVDAAVAAGVPLLLASTLAVHGARTGPCGEDDPRAAPYPDAVDGAGAFSVEGELAALTQRLELVRARAHHADRLSAAQAEAQRRLRAAVQPSSGRALADAQLALLDELFAADMVAVGRERAVGWGFTTTRGYTRALAEHAVAAAPVRSAIVRLPALGAPRQGDVDAAHAQELLDDSAPLAALLQRAERGALRVPLKDGARVELLPIDVAARALVACAGALAAESASFVVHVPTAGDGPLGARRFVELVDLHLRRRSQRDLTRRVLAVDAAPRTQNVLGAAARAAAGATLDALLRRGPPRALPKVVADAGREALQLAKAVAGPHDDEAALAEQFPFVPGAQRLVGRGLRIACARAGVAQNDVVEGTKVDWRAYLLDVHLPALAAAPMRVPTAQPAPLPAYDSLVHMLDESAVRHRAKVALSTFVVPAAGESAGDGQTIDVDYGELHARAYAAARRLRAAGVVEGSRVLISGQNDPAWVVAAFGVLVAGGVIVPVDPALAEEQIANVARKAQPTLAIVDVAARKRFEPALAAAGTPLLDVALTAVGGPPLQTPSRPAQDDLASILFTSGTTGDPKGVMLTHGNFTSLVASLGRIFDMTRGDRLLSVLPVHHTFEFTCGLLLPIAAGARVYYPGALTGERVLFGLKHGKITALVGVPALWQLLERRIGAQVKQRGELATTFFDAALAANKLLGKRLGLDAGKLLFGAVHKELGGHLRTLISGGAALPASVHSLFQGLGLPLAEGYGLTEAAPVLTVAFGGPGEPAGTVGAPIPGVRVKLVPVDDAPAGVGEIWAHGANVMKGYFGDEAATKAVKDAEGWLRTGDLGMFDDDGRLRIVGRSKDVVVTAAGENVYLDDVERKLDGVPYVLELVAFGLPDPQGGERLALVAVAGPDADLQLVAKARKALKDACAKLPAVERPAVVDFVAGPLPRTATRKVKRKDVARALTEKLAAEDEARGPSIVAITPVTRAVSLAAGVELAKLSSRTRLTADLGFDSLMWVELQGALEQALDRKLDAESLAKADTIADLEAVVRGGGGGAQAAVVDDQARVSVPAIVRAPLRAALTTLQREAYRTLFDSLIEGRERIPWDRPTIVVANHSSHLDTGLVKAALGKYGVGLRPLAAKDYFFDGHPLKRAFFADLTNLVPIDRETGSGKAFEQAKAVVQQGHVVLLFPEGTRREDGTLGDFKPLVGRLSLQTRTDVLPIHLAGTFDALPRGSFVPKARALRAVIGEPIRAADLAARTAHLPPVQAARAATAIIRDALVALASDQVNGSPSRDAGVSKGDAAAMPGPSLKRPNS